MGTNKYLSATANCALELGANIEFIDVDKDNLNISLDELERKLVTAKKIQKLPKLIIPVHFAGRPVDMGRLNNLKKIQFFYN